MSALFGLFDLCLIFQEANGVVKYGIGYWRRKRRIDRWQYQKENK